MDFDGRLGDVHLARDALVGVAFDDAEQDRLFPRREQARARLDPEDAFVIWVADTGIGISARDIERALTPFGQVGNPLTRDQQGTGLGLPLSRALVELHGGKLVLDSQLGAGTTVSVVLPWRRIMAGVGVASSAA